MTNDALWVPLKANPPYGPVGNARRDALVKYAERLARRPDFPAQLNALSSLVLAVEPEDLPDLLQQELPDLFKLLPDASVWWLDVDRVLVRRFAFLRARLALELTPDIDTSPSEFRGLRLLSTHSLTEGIDFGKSLGPALLAFSPGVSGFSISKDAGRARHPVRRASGASG